MSLCSCRASVAPRAPLPSSTPVCPDLPSLPPSLSSSSSATHTYMVTYLSCLEDDCQASCPQRMLSWKHVERPGNLCRIHGSILQRVTCVPFSCLFVHRRLENVKCRQYTPSNSYTLVTRGNNCIKENCRCSWYNEIPVTEIANLKKNWSIRLFRGHFYRGLCNVSLSGFSFWKNSFLFFSRYQAINEKSLNPVRIIFLEVFAIARINLFDVQ